jgi:Ca2+-binding RTX toxin-like protein
MNAARGGTAARRYEGQGRDVLHASDFGNNTLHGGQGADELHGWQGNDTLEGGNGRDVLEAFIGNDTRSGAETVATEAPEPTRSTESAAGTLLNGVSTLAVIAPGR